MTPNIGLEQLFRMTTQELHKELAKNSTEHGDLWSFYSGGDGKRVTVVAHIDTVHERTGVKKRIFFDSKQKVLWSPDGLGADDRAGVFGAIRLGRLLNGPLKPNLLFTDKEEQGLQGAKSASAECKRLADSLFFLGLDRRGKEPNVVFYNEEPNRFRQYICSFGFSEQTGTTSDVRVLGESFKLAGANISVGYENQHSTSEFLWLESLAVSLKLAAKLIADANRRGKVWRHSPPPIPRFNLALDLFHASDPFAWRSEYQMWHQPQWWK